MTLALAVVLPVMVTVFLVTRDSSSGEVTVSVTVTGEDGEGEIEEVGVEVGSGVGEGRVSWDSLRLLLAVQMPKVMTSPKPKPIATAKKTSFFITLALRLTIEPGIVKSYGNNLFGTCEF